MIAISTIRAVGQTSGGANGSVSESIEAYTAWLTQTGKARSTVSSAERLLTNIVYATMGCDCIDQFDADITKQFIAHQVQHRYADKTIRTQVAELKRFSKWLVRSGRFASDPLASVHFHADECESIDRVQVRFQRLFKMLEHVSNSRFGVTLEMLHEACCEVSKVCERTIRRDVDLLVSIGAILKERNPSVDLILYKANPMSSFLHGIEAKQT